MTAIGPGISTQDPIVGWEAIIPNARPLVDVVVDLAADKVNDLWHEWGQLDRENMESGAFLLERDRLSKLIQTAEREEEAARAARAEYYQKQRKPEADCTCKPDGDACVVCAAHQRQVYGDSIPVEGV